MKQNILITMAGRGSRFLEAGFHVPKYEIMAHGRSLFEWSMISLTNFFSKESRVIFVCLAENDSAEFILQEVKKFNLEDVHVVELGAIADGQATSAYLSHVKWQLDWPLLIYNIDTFVRPRALNFDCIRAGSDGWVPCVKVPGDHWSFVRVAPDGWAVELAEKRRISENASIGLYWFKRAGSYIDLYKRFYVDQNNLTLGEKYIAPLYAQLIADGGKVSSTDLPLNDVHMLGTPEELKKFMEVPMKELY